jgi:hypothetical protein
MNTFQTTMQFGETTLTLGTATVENNDNGLTIRLQYS